MRKKLGVQYLRHLMLLSKSVWLFPALLLIALICLTFLKINGSSVGVNQIVYGSEGKDTDLIFGEPRGVRSDEWLVVTQMTVAQANNGFKRVNNNIGNGEDMSLIVDVPYKEWSAAFKPQNLVFFILPLEQAFALKWWFLLFLLILACYFFVLELFPKKIGRAILVSSLVGLSPFVFWWYQTITVLPLAYSFLLLIFIMRLVKATSFRARLGYSLAATYILICFGLLLYPPFQIPCLIVSGIFLIGWILDNQSSQVKLKNLWKLWPYITMILLLVGLVGGLFYYTRKSVISTINNTVYPGTRIITSGGPTPLLSFSSFLSPNLQYDQKAAVGYLGNQSEASNFIFMAPFLFLPSIYVIVQQKRKHHKMLWSLLLINALLAFFLARMYIATPSWVEPIYRVFLLHKVPNTRLLIGLGFAGIIQLLLFMRALETSALKKREIGALAIVGGLTSITTLLYIGIYTIHHFPIFISSYPKVLLFSLWVTAGVVLILLKRFGLGLSVLVLFSLLSVYRVNPLYHGLAPLTKAKAITTIKSYPNNGNWVVLDDRLLINFPVIAGKHSINSVQFYPQLDLWAKLDKSKHYQTVYNRFAHIVFVTDPELHEPFSLKYADTFYVKFEPCGEFLQTNAKYVLSEKPLTQSCMQLDRLIDLEKRDFYIYRLTPATP